jgi:SAM-dependent methyltransferase
MVSGLAMCRPASCGSASLAVCFRFFRFWGKMSLSPFPIYPRFRTVFVRDVVDIMRTRPDSLGERNKRLHAYLRKWRHGYQHRSISEEAWQRNAQPDFLKKHGLMPHHVFLDLGCGYLRGTIDLIDYLEDGHFYGLDISQANIQSAKVRASRECRHRPNLTVSDRFHIGQTWPNVRFDFILAASLITHLWPAEVERCLQEVSRVLIGKFYATIFKDNTVAVYDGWCGSCIDHKTRHSSTSMRRWLNRRNLNFCYNTLWMEQTAKRSNLALSEIGSTEIGQFMLEISPARY